WDNAELVQQYARADRVTRPFGRVLVDNSGIAASVGQGKDVHAIDLATGTGAVIQGIYDAVPTEGWSGLKVTGTDVSQHMLDYLKGKGEREGWTGLQTQIADGNNLRLPAETYTHAFVSFGIFVMKDSALPNIHAALKPGGFVGLTTWARLGWLPLFYKAMAELEDAPYTPTEKEFEGTLYQDRDWTSPAFVSSVLQSAGFTKVETEVKKYRLPSGTAKQLVDSLQMPLRLMGAFWDESIREE
ncbi:S-adenosyl-L-methionine-dependent methyltransferase, partial [Polyplosphaeria fusca]